MNIIATLWSPSGHNYIAPDRSSLEPWPARQNSYPRTSFTTEGNNSCVSTGDFNTLKILAFVLDHHRAAPLRSLTELTDFSDAPVRMETRREDRHECGGLPEMIDSVIGKDVVPLQFVVSPDHGCLAESHAQERRVKAGLIHLAVRASAAGCRCRAQLMRRSLQKRITSALFLL
jgi:hypothetical protein